MKMIGPVTTCETLVDQHSQWPHIPCQSKVENTAGETHEYICTPCKNSLLKTSLYARPSLSKWLTHSSHTPGATGHHTIREKNNISVYSIFNSVNHEKI